MPGGLRICGELGLAPGASTRRSIVVDDTTLGPKAGTPRSTSFHQYGKWYPPGMKEKKRFGYEIQEREQVPLCQDLRPGVLFEGEKCWSKCGLPTEEDCMPRVMTLPEEGEFEMVKHPACQSHVECVGQPRRVLCEVVKKGSWQEGLMTRMAQITGPTLWLASVSPGPLPPRRAAHDFL